MFSRERVTCFKIELKPKFEFRSKGAWTHLTPPKGVHYQWAPKGSYWVEKILGMIDKSPNRFNIFAEQSSATYVLDNYCVHLMPEIQQALFKKGYVLITIGGSITGDI